MRSLVYVVAASIDGFMAGPDGDTSVLEEDLESAAAVLAAYPDTCPTHLRDRLGITGPPERFDTVVMGARTHQPALDAGLTSAYPHLRQYVATHRALPTDPADPAVTRIEGDVRATVRGLKAEDGLDIWLCGGGDLAAQLIDDIDELHLKVHPVVLGGGVPFLGPAGTARPEPTRLEMTGAEPMPGGVVVLTYLRA